MNVDFRPAKIEDIPFIAHAWASEMRRSPMARGVPAEVYWPSQHELIRRILGGAAVTMAVDPEAPDSLMGCIVFHEQARVMHWLYVQGIYRRLGVATKLFAQTFDGRDAVWASQITNWMLDHRDVVERKRIVPTPYVLVGTNRFDEQDRARRQTAPDPASDRH